MPRVSYLRGLAGPRSGGAPGLKPWRMPLWPLATGFGDSQAAEIAPSNFGRAKAAPPALKESLVPGPPGATSSSPTIESARPSHPERGSVPAAPSVRVASADRQNLPPRPAGESYRMVADAKPSRETGPPREGPFTASLGPTEELRLEAAARRSEGQLTKSETAERDRPASMVAALTPLETIAALATAVRVPKVDHSETILHSTEARTVERTIAAEESPQVVRAAIAPPASVHSAPPAASAQPPRLTAGHEGDSQSGRKPASATGMSERRVFSPAALLAPVATGRPASHRDEPPAGNRIHIGAIEIHIAPPPQAPPQQRRTPAQSQAPAPAISRGFTSSFGLRQA
jgi:hypothetical protein